MKRFLATLVAVMTLISPTWGAVVGNSTVESSSITSFPGRSFGAMGSGFVYTAVAGDAVDSLVWYGNWGTDATNLTIEMGIYTVASSLPDSLVGTAASVTVSSGTDQWWAVQHDVTLIAGEDYCIMWVARSSHSYSGKRKGETNGSSQGVISGGALPAVHSHSSFFGVSYSVYGNVTNTPASSGPPNRLHLGRIHGSGGSSKIHGK